MNLTTELEKCQMFLELVTRVRFAINLMMK